MTDNKLPIFPLDSIVFPHGLLALRIFETRYIDMVRDCMRDKSSFVVTANQKPEDNDGEIKPYDIGTRVEIVDFEQLPDGLLGITVAGKEKVSLSDIETQADNLLVATTHACANDSQEGIPDDFIVLSKVLQKMFPEILSHYGENLRQYLIEDYEDASWVGSRLVEVLPIDVQTKMELLRMQDAGERVRIIYEALQRMQVI